MDRNTRAFIVFTLSLVVAFLISATVFAPDSYGEDLDFRIEAGDGVKTLEFEQNITFMVSDRGEADFFVDVNGDGSPDRELEIVRDGEVHELRELVSVGEETYLLSIRYHDGPGENDSWLEVYRVERV